MSVFSTVVVRALASAAVAVAGLGLTSSAASADSCANAAVRAQNGSTGLPDCRAYELVTSSFKEGFAPQFADMTPDIDGTLAYKSTGNFAGNGTGGVFNQYVATRSPSGWLTTSPDPPGTSYGATIVGAEALSDDKRSSLWVMRRVDEPSEVLDYYVRRPDGTFKRVGPGANPATLPPSSPGPSGPTQAVNVLASSADLSHFIFSSPPNAAFPGIVSGATFNLYEYVGTGNDHPSYVGVNNAGTQIAPGCSTNQANGAPADLQDGTHLMSTDGRVIFWKADCLSALFARVNGSVTVEASASHCTRSAADPGGLCNDPSRADFVSASADGSRVYFTTSQQLVNSDTDATEDLYECDIPAGSPTPLGLFNPCAALRLVSAGSPSGAEVESVARVSDDGSRAYFIAKGVLATNVGANNAGAVAGDNNLYVWQQDGSHPAGQTTFVGKLDVDHIDPFVNSAETTSDGRYLLLGTSSQLIASGPEADTDDAADMYRYDADTRQIVRLSSDEGGSGGNTNGLNATTQGPSITADGQTAVFATEEGLSPDDTNGTLDMYEWHGGHLSPLGAGTIIGMTKSGSDIYFITGSRLTPNDGDTLADFYDLRTDGGFDFSKPVPCNGAECQGNSSAPPGVTSPHSDTTAGSVDNPLAAPSFDLQAVTAAQRKKLASTGKIKLKVSASTPATLAATATATVAHKPVRVASAHRTLAAPGTTSLTLTLSKRARAQLAAVGKLTVRVVVSNSKVAVNHSATLKLTHTKTKKKTTKKRKETKSSSAQRTAAADRGARS